MKEAAVVREKAGLGKRDVVVRAREREREVAAAERVWDRRRGRPR